jgi:hypothetical protein
VVPGAKKLGLGAKHPPLIVSRSRKWRAKLDEKDDVESY